MLTNLHLMYLLEQNVKSGGSGEGINSYIIQKVTRYLEAAMFIVVSEVMVLGKLAYQIV